jgi:hypothetical protein
MRGEGGRERVREGYKSGSIVHSNLSLEKQNYRPQYFQTSKIYKVPSTM